MSGGRSQSLLGHDKQWVLTHRAVGSRGISFDILVCFKERLRKQGGQVGLTVRSRPGLVGLSNGQVRNVHLKGLGNGGRERERKKCGKWTGTS